VSAEAIGRRFAEAIAEKDADRLRAVLTDDVDFRGLTPNRQWEATGPQAVADIVFGSWFEPGDRFDRAPEIQTDSFAGCHRVGYRFHGQRADGPFVVEQQAYWRERDGRIAWMRIVCSGFRLAEAA
jgi:ketosteroid isomerase-like protein